MQPAGAESVRGRFTAGRREALLDVLRQASDVLVIENDHASDIVGTELNSLASGGFPRWEHVRTVTKRARARPSVR
ncbi:hypothetical protein [Streptomyces sp. NBC_00829]|uniref:hypothetical protein n=1 Tax=Streptomyces sp. NBC_00829 TaxID=2903679 RepID=UPI0038695069|nr:hypothetical protein OG293_30970 [Streptomyces sp. NBC_00829]